MFPFVIFPVLLLMAAAILCSRPLLRLIRTPAGATRVLQQPVQKPEV